MRRIEYGTEFLDGESVQELSRVDWRLAAITYSAVQAFLLERRKEQPNWNHRVRVTDGFRTPEEQQELFARGATQTLKSHHLEGRAVDLAYIRGGIARWEWTWYQRLDGHMQAAAGRFGLDPGDLLWGGQWTTLRDGVHWQLMLPVLPDTFGQHNLNS